MKYHLTIPLSNVILNLNSIAQIQNYAIRVSDVV
jgi:hypothetical protein